MSDRPDGTRSPGFGCRSLLSGPSRLLLLAIVGLFSPLLCHAFILLSHSASARQYEVGQTYTYDYFTTVILDEPIRLGVSPSKNVGYQLTGYVTVQAVWQNPERTSERLLQINLDTPQLFVRSRKAPTPDGFIFHASQLSSLSMHPLYVLWSQGKITNVYYVQADTPSLVNIKKGIASLFQYQLTARTIEEVDASGRCQATYLGDATSERVIVKKKRECQVPKNLNFFSHPVKALSADVITDNEIFYSFSREESIIEEVKAQEKHSLHVHSWKVAAGRVVSDQHLKLTGSSTNSEAVDAQDENSAIKALNRRLGHKLVLDNLTAEEEVKYCSENCLTLAQMVDDFRDSLRKNMTGTIRSSSVYLRLLVKARDAAPEMLAKVLKSPQNKDILPVLIDVMAAAQTFQAHQAAMDVLNFRSESKIDLTERYLWALSVTSHPPEEILADMLKHAKAEIPSEKLHETVILTLASLTDRFCAKKGNCQKKIVEDVQKFLYKQLEGCDDADCKVLFLRAINNVQLVKNVQVFTRFMDSGERKTAVAAAKGLHNLPLNFIKEKDLQFLEEVYAQLRKKRDSTVRTIAADILLRKDPSVERLAFLLSTLGDQESHELKTFIVERIRDLIHLDEGLKQKLRTLLGDKKYGNYHVWGQRGRSTAFTRYLYEDGSKGSNGSFVAAMELGGGMLKRIKFDVNLGEEDSVSTLLSLGVFAGGLNSFSSSNQEEVDPEEAEESATAGIELSLLGSQLRPFVFFNGQGELMGHLWSGTASSRTPALQGIYLLHDHSQKIALSNGIMAQLSLLGGISLDLGGQVEISLWYKTAHSLIDNKAAFVIRGSATADTSFVQSQLEFNLAADSQLQLVTDSDFSDKTIMCIQMSQPEFHLKHKVRKWEHIIGQKHRLHKSLKRTHVVPGRTFVMNQKNSELCNIMFKDKS